MDVDLEQFYNEDPRRRHSEELEFGRDWIERGRPLRSLVGRGDGRGVRDARTGRGSTAPTGSAECTKGASPNTIW